jgi:hypothetical protein
MAAEAFYFLLDQKVTKNQVSREASLRSGPLPGSSAKTTGCNTFAPVVAHRPPLQQKLANAPPNAQGPPVLPALIRSLSADALSIKPSFCRILKSLNQENLVLYRNCQTGGFWAKDDKTWWDVRREGHSVFCPSVKALSERSRGANYAARGLGKGPVRKEASLLT